MIEAECKPTFGEKLYYELDRLLSWSPAARFLLLAGISFGLIFICAILYMIFAPESVDLFTALWWALVRVIDTGAFGDEEYFGPAFIAVICAICGLAVVASLIGKKIFPFFGQI